MMLSESDEEKMIVELSHTISKACKGTPILITINSLSHALCNALLQMERMLDEKIVNIESSQGRPTAIN